MPESAEDGAEGVEGCATQAAAEAAARENAELEAWKAKAASVLSAIESAGALPEGRVAEVRLFSTSPSYLLIQGSSGLIRP